MSNNYRLVSTLILFFFGMILKSSAQNYEVINLESLLNSQASTQRAMVQKSRMTKSASNSETEMNIQLIKSLVYDVKPTVFIEDQQLKHFEDQAPEVADVSSNSLQLLKNDSPLFKKVELLKIKLNSSSENIKIDFDELTGFKSLKYIYVECSFNCSVSDIENMFFNTGDLKILYLITQPE